MQGTLSKRVERASKMDVGMTAQIETGSQRNWVRVSGRGGPAAFGRGLGRQRRMGGVCARGRDRHSVGKRRCRCR